MLELRKSMVLLWKPSKLLVIFIFFISDKDSRERFFEASFLLADVKPDIIFEMSFLTMSNTDIDFQARDLQ